MLKCSFRLTLFFLLFSLTGLSQNYIPDSTFGINSSLTLSNPWIQARKFIKVSNGGLLVFTPARLFRVDSSGGLDLTFGSNGFVRLDSLCSPTGAKSVAWDSLHNTIAIASNIAIVFQLNVNGALDSSFAVDGKYTTPYITSGTPYFLDIAYQMDGKIVVAGHATNINNNDKQPLLIRLTTDGTLDSTFGNNGIKVNGITSPNVESRLNCIRILPNGKIIAAGTMYNFYDEGFTVRFNSSGKVDSSFGTNGYVVYSYSGQGNYMFIYNLEIQPDGKLVFGGNVQSNPEPAPGNAAFVYRTLPNGFMDNSFGSGGKFFTTPPSFSSGLSNLCIQPDGKLLLGYRTINISVCSYPKGGSLKTKLL